MQNRIFFNIPTYTIGMSTFPKPDHGYNYWVPLANYFLVKSNRIEIHCWNEEMDTIEELMKIESLEVSKQEKMTVFKGIKTPILTDLILNHSLNQKGEFKWFTVNLDYDSKSVFHSGHWGTEFFVPNASEEDIKYIKNVTPHETSF